MKCNYCGRERQTSDLARVWRSTAESRDHDDELYVLLCHGVDDAHPTCYEHFQALRGVR